MGTHQPLALKYRPRRFSQVVGQDAAVAVLRGMVTADKIANLIIIHGPTGCGKTTLARILARYCNCQSKGGVDKCDGCASCKAFRKNRHPDIHERDGGTFTGIDDVRALQQVVALQPRYRRKIYIMDECYPGETMVMIDYDTCVPIEKVYRTKSITHVLAYDLKQKRIVRKRILRKLQRPYSGPKVTVFFADGTSFWCTHKQKLYVVGRGYVPADEIVAGDRLISYAGDFTDKSVCPYCDALLPKPRGLTTHIRQKHIDATRLLAYYQRITGVKQPAMVVAKTGAGVRRFWQSKSPRSIELAQQISARQTGRDHYLLEYMTPAEASALISQQRKNWWKSMLAKEREARIRTFMNAPLHTRDKPNRVEQAVIAFGISGLKFVGDGSLFVTMTLPDGQKHKNPDFVYKEQGKVKKVIEVMDFEYWHTRREARQVQQGYQQLGYDCLVVDAARIKKKPELVRGEIEAFCHNHYVTVDKVTTSNSHRGGWSLRKRPVVYDLEVEGAHNFFVVPGTYSRDRHSCATLGTPVLSSNCHALSKAAWTASLKMFEEPPADVTFVLCTTEVARLPAAIQGRAIKLALNPLNDRQLVDLIRAVAKHEGLKLPKDAAEKVAYFSQGHPRNALNALERVLLALQGGKQLDLEKEAAKIAESTLGLAPWQVVDKYVAAVLSGNANNALKLASAVETRERKKDESDEEFHLRLKDERHWLDSHVFLAQICEAVRMHLCGVMVPSMVSGRFSFAVRNNAEAIKRYWTAEKLTELLALFVGAHERIKNYVVPEYDTLVLVTAQALQLQARKKQED